MERDNLKLQLQRLVGEAPRIAPSIARFSERGDYGSVTDEKLDSQNFVRWEVEARTILQQLSNSDAPVFRELYAEYQTLKDNSKKFHSRSILVHKVMELLVSATQLLDSSLTTATMNSSSQTNLDPWPVIRGVLLDLDSYEVPKIIDRAGLTVDWTLKEKQDYSHKTRLAAYRPRIDAAYQALSSDDRLRVAYIVANEVASRGSADQLGSALREIGWVINQGRLAPDGATVRELFFPERSQHDAYVEIRGIFQRATASITIVDPYVDQSILTILSTCLHPGMSARLLTSRLPTDFLLEAKKWLAQNPETSLEVRTMKEFHDRFIVLDDASCWHVGCSIKDAGNKAFMLSQVEDGANRAALLTQIGASWSAGATVL